jgi:hypothetical protein
MTTKKTCLLIAPLSFYSYSEYIKNELSRVGYEVIISNDEYPANTIGKILGKLKIPLLLWITKPRIVNSFLKGKKYDLTVIIKGRGMSSSLIKEIKKVCPKVIGYTYDSFKFHPHPKKWYKNVDAFFTFDYSDAKKNNLEVIELFSSLPDTIGHKEKDYEISGIARNHSKRLHFIDLIMSTISNNKKSIYIYEQNLVTFFSNFTRNPLLYLKYRKFIHFKPLTYKKYIDILNRSNFVIDYAHPDQSGITIRCYEAQSCGAKIITNNPSVFKDKHFNSDNTILLKGKNEIPTLLEKYNTLKNIVPEKYNRSINVFVNDLLEKGKVESLPVKSLYLDNICIN